MTISDAEHYTRIKKISKMSLECIRDISSKGDALTVETLADYLSKADEGKQIFESEELRNDDLINESDDPGIRNKFLKNENERIQKQKNKLLQQLDEIESKSYDAEKLYIRMLLFFVDVSGKKAGEELGDDLKRFKNTLKKSEPIAQLETIFTDLKNTFIRADLTADNLLEASSKESSFMSKLLKSTKSTDVQAKFVFLIKESYQSIIDELGLDLGTNYLNKLLKIGKNLQTANDANDFELLKNDIIGLLHEYISDVCDERESTAKFIKDIGVRLLEVESNLISTLEITDKSIDSSINFNDFMESEMGNFKRSVNHSNSFEELKTAVTQKISEIANAIMNKKKNDNSLKNNIKTNSEQLVSGFNVMKSEAEKAREKISLLEKELYTDPLTGAMNRRAYTNKINEEFLRFSRYKNKFSILIFDVDHFKKINDTYGHATGDKCLVEIIKRVKKVIRKSDMLARFGGEEFVVVLPETLIEGAMDVAEKIRESVENIEFIHKNEVVRITVSLGVAQVEETDETTEELFERMDAQLYQAKKSGRNRVMPKLP
jgi:diguanylate cyclase (GGDEF)-like protein